MSLNVSSDSDKYADLTEHYSYGSLHTHMYMYTFIASVVNFILS